MSLWLPVVGLKFPEVPVPTTLGSYPVAQVREAFARSLELSIKFLARQTLLQIFTCDQREDSAFNRQPGNGEIDGDSDEEEAL